MAITRRAVLRTGAASVVLFGAAGGWLSTRTSVSAREPWQKAGDSFGDPRLDALAYAILAPNPHNMQPWQVSLTGDDGFLLTADLFRLLPETDPPARQITIGFGAFLELYRQAAAELGYGVSVDPFPRGEPFPTLDQRPIAYVRLIADANPVPDPLFRHTLTRRTQRAVFDEQRPVSDEMLAKLLATPTNGVLIAANNQQAQRDTLRELTAAAWVAEWENQATRQESIDVTRLGKEEVSRHPWGITLDGALLDSLSRLGILTTDAMDTPGSTAYNEGLNGYLRSVNSAMAHLWSTTPGNTRRDQLNAGAAWVRLHQAATGEGLAFHPLSQALQEFPAMAAHYRQIHEMLAEPGHTVQMLVRLGYAGAASPAPREPITSKLLPA